MLTKCPTCKADVSSNAQSCPNCTSRIPSVQSFCCKNCGATVVSGQKFCPNCGRALEWKRAPPEIPQSKTNAEKDTAPVSTPTAAQSAPMAPVQTSQLTQTTSPSLKIKGLGGLGAFLMFLAPFTLLKMSGEFFLLIEVLGLILMLISLKGLANYYTARGIFYNVVIAILVAVVGGVVTFEETWHSVSPIISSPFSSWTLTVLSTYIQSIFTAILIFFVFLIVTAVFARQSLSLLSKNTNVDLFSLAGTMLIFGAILSFMIVGFLLIWVALLFLGIAFFSIGHSKPPQNDAVGRAIGHLNSTYGSRSNRGTDCGCTRESSNSCRTDYSGCDQSWTWELEHQQKLDRDEQSRYREAEEKMICGSTCNCTSTCSADCGCTCTCTVTCSADCGCTCTGTCNDCGCTYTCNDCGCTSTCSCTFTCAPN